MRKPTRVTPLVRRAHFCILVGYVLGGLFPGLAMVFAGGLDWALVYLAALALCVGPAWHALPRLVTLPRGARRNRAAIPALVFPLVVCAGTILADDTSLILVLGIGVLPCVLATAAVLAVRGPDLDVEHVADAFS